MTRARTRPPTARSVLLRFAIGSAAAIVIALVGGFFALRSVAIDQAKRETRTRVQEAGPARRVDARRRARRGQAGGRAVGRRRRRLARPEQLDRAGQDLVGGRARPLLRRSRPDRRAVRARPGAASPAARRRRQGRGERPRPAGERARPRAGRSDRGVHADQGAVGHAAPLRDLPARRLGHGKRAAASRRRSRRRSSARSR